MKRYLSVLSVISCFGVILMHSNTLFWTFSDSPTWFVANLTGHMLNFAVPIFFMISGVNLLDYRSRYTTKEYFIKRIRKTFLPFLIWSTLGVVYGMVIYNHEFGTISQFIYNIFSTRIVEYYWFFIPLFMIYLSIPIFSYITERGILLYTILFIFIFVVLLPFLFNISSTDQIGNLTFPITGWIIYPLLGYYISHYEIPKVYRLIIYTLGVIGWFMLVLGTYLLSIRAGHLVQDFMGYLNIPNVAISAAILLFLKEADKFDKFTSLFKICGIISKYTFGIYLTHWFVIKAIYDTKFIPTDNVYFITVGAVCVFSVCLLLTWLIKHIPYIKKLIPD